jgi:hypothetical protein
MKDSEPEDQLTKADSTPGGDTPSGDNEDDNIVLFYDKSKLEKFFGDLLSYTNLLLV